MRTAVDDRFVDAEVLRLLERIRSLSSDERRTEVYQLVPRHGRSGVITALEIGTDEPHGTWGCSLYATDSLIDHPAISTPILIEILDQHPLSRVTQTAAYVLGEIAYKQGEERDPRIVEVALRFLERTRAAGFKAMGPALGLARELSRAAPLPEASPYARAFIEEIERNRTELTDGYEALGILYQNEKLQFLDELGDRVRALDVDHPLHAAVETFIAEITGPMLGARSFER